MHSGHLGVQDASVGERLEQVEDNQNLELRKAKTVFSAIWHKVQSSGALEGESEAAVYVVKGQQESLLGWVDSEKLGIITIRYEGKPGTEPVSKAVPRDRTG